MARALGKMGHRADILTRRIVDPEWPEFAAPTDSYPGHPNVRILRIPCGPERYLPKEELWPYLGEWTEGVARWYREEGRWPDLWTGHYADGGLCAALLEERSGVPFTFTGHSLGAWKLDLLLRDSAGDPGALPETDSRYSFGARIEAERAAVARAAAVITNSSAELREQYVHPAYRDLVDPADSRLTVIPPGVNLDIFDPKARSPWEDEVRDRISEAHERDIAPQRRRLPAVISWSRLDPKKNHLALVRAFARSPELQRRANLVMITRDLDDPLRDPGPATEEQRQVLRALTAEIERSELWGSVSAFSLSGQTALAALYRWGAATGGVFCLPAEYEPFGLTVVEAMAAGLPVVATRNGGPYETTDGGRAGLLADPHDPEDIAAQLLRPLSNRDTWSNYADRGRERAREHYSWSSTARGYLRLAGEIPATRQNPSFPLPEFIRQNAPARLPRLRGWESATADTEMSTGQLEKG